MAIEIENGKLEKMIIESIAPPRVDLAGGTIDIWPLYLFHPGATTVNFALSLYARSGSRLATTDASFSSRAIAKCRLKRISRRSKICCRKSGWN